MLSYKVFLTLYVYKITCFSMQFLLAKLGK